MASIDQIVAELTGISDPWKLLKRAAEFVPEGQMTLGTSGQLTGTAIIEGAHQHDIPLHVYTVDTLRLFPETVDYFDVLERHYSIKIERVRPDDHELSKMIDKHGAFLFFDSKAKQEYCCEIRKVRPNYRALADKTIWVTGLRHDQSAFRKAIPMVQVVDVPDPSTDGDDKRNRLVKIAPLISWSESDVRSYLEAENAPIHPLLQESESEWFFESLGCVICTTRQAKWEPPRAGRWRWFNDNDPEKKECGIHLPPISRVEPEPPGEQQDT